MTETLSITEQREIVSKAKARLMETFRMREPEAHAFIRNLAMERRVKMYIIAKVILSKENLT
jgi:AmiR/NasT family two-component response regulator